MTNMKTKRFSRSCTCSNVTTKSFQNFSFSELVNVVIVIFEYVSLNETFVIR